MFHESIQTTLNLAIQGQGLPGKLEFFKGVDDTTFEPMMRIKYLEEGKDPKVLQARWVLELEEELKSFYAIDIEAEITKALIQEIMYELAPENTASHKEILEAALAKATSAGKS